MTTNTQKGFSLLELLLVLIIISVMANAILPRFTALYARYELRLAKHQLSNLLDDAALTASLQHQPVVIRPQVAQHWNSGQIIWLKGNRVRSYAPLSKHIRIHWQGFDSKAIIKMYPIGDFHQTNGRFVLTHVQTGEQAHITMNSYGRVRSRVD